jgi:hypothetical protein
MTEIEVLEGPATTRSAGALTPWEFANWQATPQQIAFALLSTGGSSCAG